MMAYAWWCLWSILSTYLHIFIQDIHILLPITLLDWNPFRKSEFLKLIIVDDYYSNFCKFLLEMVFGMFCTSCKSSFFHVFSFCVHFIFYEKSCQSSYFYPRAMAPERVLPLSFFFSFRNSSHNLQTKMFPNKNLHLKWFTNEYLHMKIYQM